MLLKLSVHYDTVGSPFPSPSTCYENHQHTAIITHANYLKACSSFVVPSKSSSHRISFSTSRSFRCAMFTSCTVLSIDNFSSAILHLLTSENERPAWLPLSPIGFPGLHAQLTTRLSIGFPRFISRCVFEKTS